MRVYDSYAHHPNEIAGDLQAARSLAGEGRVVVAFQPHLVSRTKIFGPAMGVALGAADDVVVMDVYVAREDPEPGVNGELVASHVPLDAEHVHFEPSWSATPAALVERARPGDLVLTLGAGDVTLVGPEVLELLAERERMSLFTRDDHAVDDPDERRAHRPDRPQALRAPPVGPPVAGVAPRRGGARAGRAGGLLALAGVRLLRAGRLRGPGRRHGGARPARGPSRGRRTHRVAAGHRGPRRDRRARRAAARGQERRRRPGPGRARCASTSPSARRSRWSSAATCCAASTTGA